MSKYKISKAKILRDMEYSKPKKINNAAILVEKESSTKGIFEIKYKDITDIKQEFSKQYSALINLIFNDKNEVHAFQHLYAKTSAIHNKLYSSSSNNNLITL